MGDRRNGFHNWIHIEHTLNKLKMIILLHAIKINLLIPKIIQFLDFLIYVPVVNSKHLIKCKNYYIHHVKAR